MYVHLIYKLVLPFIKKPLLKEVWLVKLSFD